MKKLLSLFVCIFCISLLCACDTPPKQVRVNLNLDGGEIVGESVYEATVGENLTLPAPTKTGYTFNGWTYNGEAVNLTPFNLEVDSATLKAEWLVKSYNVVVNFNGGVIIEDGVELQGTELQVEYGEQINLPAPTKYGYDLVGYEFANGDEAPSNIWDCDVDDPVITAKWQAKKVNYTFELLGGSGNFADGVIAYGESTASIKALIPEHDSGNFVCWLVNGRILGDEWTYLPENNQTVTLVAKYERYFVLTFVHYNSEQEFINVNSDIGVNFEEIPVPKTQPGYTAVWSLTNDEICLLTESTIITAELLPNKYTVIFKNGTLTESSVYTYNETYTLPTKVRDGYTFLGWSTSQDGSSGVIKGEYKWEFDRVITLFAIYEEKTYNVNYDTSNIKVDFELVNDENEVVSGTQQVTFSKPYNLYTVKTKNNVASVVWEYNGAQLSASGNWNIATDVKLTAKIVVNEVEIAVKVDVNGGSGEQDCTLTLTKPLSSLTQMPTAPTGKRLVGFNYKGTFYSLSDVFNHYDYDGTPLVAVYADRVFITVNVDVNGGTGESTATVELGEKLSFMQNKPKAPTGKKLVGFYYKDTFYDLNAVFDVEDYDGEVLTAHYINDDEDWSPLG